MNTPTMIEKGPAIQIAAHNCDDKLSDMIQTIHGGKTALKELQQRFQAWANNSGVFAGPHLCLDARLRGHHRPQKIILMLLNLIQDNLDTAADIEELSRNADMDYLESAFKGVSGALERLNHVATLITRSSRVSRPIRVGKYAQEHQNDFAGMNETIKNIVSFKFPDIHGLLKAQIIRSLIYRRQRLEYERSRQDRLYNVRTKEADATAQHDDESASTFHGSLFSEGMSSEGDSRSVSTAETAKTGIRYPRPPKPETVEDITRKCQYCHKHFAAEKFTETLWWRRHVNEDLQPFVCISNECAYSSQTFARLSRWQLHMETKHGLGWMHRAQSTESTKYKQSAECFMCKEIVTELGPPRGSSGVPDSLGSPRSTMVSDSSVNKMPRRQVQFLDQPKSKAIADSRSKNAEATKANRNKSKLTRHIAYHLQSLCYQTISVGVDDEDAEEDDEFEETTSTDKKGSAPSDHARDPDGAPVGDSVKASSEGPDLNDDATEETKKLAMRQDLDVIQKQSTGEFVATDTIIDRYADKKVLQKVLLSFKFPKHTIKVKATKADCLEIQLPRKLTPEEIEKVHYALKKAQEVDSEEE